MKSNGERLRSKARRVQRNCDNGDEQHTRGHARECRPLRGRFQEEAPPCLGANAITLACCGSRSVVSSHRLIRRWRPLAVDFYACETACKCQDKVTLLHHKILSPRMMHHNGRCTLLRFQQEARSQPHAYVLLRLEQREELCLVLQIGTRWIAERIARAAIL